MAELGCREICDPDLVIGTKLNAQKKWCAREDLNLFLDFTAEGNSGFASTNTRRNACCQKLPFANFPAHMQLFCQELSGKKIGNQDLATRIQL